MRMRICSRGQQTGGKKSAKQLHFCPILLTDDSYNTRQPSVVQFSASKVFDCAIE